MTSDDPVITVSETEAHASVRESLARLGLTYDQLAEQARRGEFTSPRAQALWTAIGGTMDPEKLDGPVAADALRERCAAAAARADGQPWNLLMPAEREVYLRVTDAVLEVVQSSYVPPPPGSDRDKLPDRLLALIEMGPYLSTACETAHALERVIPVHTDMAAELAEWAEREHASCRQTRKQDMTPCRCPHHQARPMDAHLDEVGE